MAYATQQNLEERLAAEVLVVLADDNSDGAADSAVLTAALADASATIDQQLARRYETPVAAPPEILTRWCVDLAAEALFLRKREALPAEHKERAELARAALESISTGQAGLAGATERLDAFETENTQRRVERVFDENELDLF